MCAKEAVQAVQNQCTIGGKSQATGQQVPLFLGGTIQKVAWTHSPILARQRDLLGIQGYTDATGNESLG
jgi:hypothetical protein